MADNKTCPHCGKPVPPTALGDLCPECMLKAGLATQTEGPGEAHGSRFVPPPVGEIARLFPQLEILRLIGQGGMGAVYKARQPALDRFVALKVLPPAAAGDPGFAERFNREARALTRLNHPNIVVVHDFGVVGPASTLSPSEKQNENSETGKMPVLHYLVMEFVDGANLREVERLGELTPEQALTIVPQICEALQFAHNEGIVHRDIKPENLLLDKKGRVKITDFGIAKMVGVGAGPQNLTGAKDVVGTPHYMAPEQIEKPLSVDHRADIYSLGVVFYEMLTGELPLGKFQPPSKKVQIDVRLDEVVLHALEKEPDRRYQQASQVKTAVETIVTTPPAGAPMSRTEPAPTAAQIEAVRQLLKIPARGLIATGVLLVIFALGLLVLALPAIASERGGLPGYAAVCFGAAAFMLLATIVLFGATRMLKLRNHTFCVVSSLVAAFAGPGALLGLPFGVWAVLVLNRPEVRAAFTANQPSADSKAAPNSTQLNLARAQVKGPGLGLVVTGVLDWVLMTAFCVFVSFSIALKSPGSMFVWLPLLAMALSGWIIYAGLKLMQLERRGVAMLGALLAILVSPGNLIGLPLGIWALVVLNRREVREAFEAIRQLENRNVPSSDWNQKRLSPAATAFRRGKRVGLGVFLLVVVAAVIITLLLPKQYAATAIVRLTGPEPVDPYQLQTEVEIIQSQPVLEPVAVALNLDQRWGQRLAGGAALSDDQTVVLMKRMIDVRPMRNTALVEIRFYSDSSAEAAEIANKITETYCALPHTPRPNIIERASVPSYPIRPNVPLNIYLGIVAGGILGIILGLATGLLSFWRMRTASPPRLQTPDPFWRHFAVTIAAILGALMLIPVLLVLLAMFLPAFNAARSRMDAEPGQSLIPPQSLTNFYIGRAWFPQGDSIEITSVERTQNQMTVKGHYNLVSRDQATLALYITSKNLNVSEDTSQRMEISKGHGDFELIHSHVVPGLPHVEMYANRKAFANLYFGTRVEAQQESQAGWITNVSSAASTETWSPSYAAGVEPDLLNILNILNSARNLMAEGSYEEALQRYLWYFDHSKNDAGQRGVRLSFALSDWIELGQRYPKARQALIEIRDADARQFSESAGDADLFQEIAGINHYLNDDATTLALFKVIEQRNPQLAGQCYYFAEHLLVQKGEYETCRKYMGDPQAAFERIRQARQRMKQLEAQTVALAEEQRKRFQEMAKTNSLYAHVPFFPEPRPFVDKNFVGQTRQLIEILVATGDKPEAKQIQGEALAVLDDPKLKSAVSDAEEKIQQRAGSESGSQAMISTATSSEPNDLREAKAHLAELRVDYSEQSPVIQAELARIKELERLTKEEPNLPPDLREAKAHLAELREDYAEQSLQVQGALARIKVLEEENGIKTKTDAVPGSQRSAQIDPNTGLPLPAGATNLPIDPATGLPMSPGETGVIDPVTGLPAAPALTKGH